MQRAATAPSPSSVGSGSHRNGCSDGGGSALVQTGARLAKSSSKFAPTSSHDILAIQHGAVGAQIPLDATERSNASTHSAAFHESERPRDRRVGGALALANSTVGPAQAEVATLHRSAKE